MSWDAAADAKVCVFSLFFLFCFFALASCLLFCPLFILSAFSALLVCLSCPSFFSVLLFLSCLPSRWRSREKTEGIEVVKMIRSGRETKTRAELDIIKDELAEHNR
jgi:hypothetical protein